MPSNEREQYLRRSFHILRAKLVAASICVALEAVACFVLAMFCDPWWIPALLGSAMLTFAYCAVLGMPVSLERENRRREQAKREDEDELDQLLREVTEEAKEEFEVGVIEEVPPGTLVYDPDEAEAEEARWMMHEICNSLTTAQRVKLLNKLYEEVDAKAPGCGGGCKCKKGPRRTGGPQSPSGIGVGEILGRGATQCSWLVLPCRAGNCCIWPGSSGPRSGIGQDSL